LFCWFCAEVVAAEPRAVHWLEGAWVVEFGQAYGESGGRQKLFLATRSFFWCLARMLWVGFFDAAEFERVVGSKES